MTKYIEASEFIGYKNVTIIASGHAGRRLTMVTLITTALEADVTYKVTDIGNSGDPIVVTSNLEEAVKVYNFGI